MSETPNSGDGEEAAEEALAAAKKQKRHTSEPSASQSGGEGRTEAIKNALLEIDAGDAPENINVRDSNLKALLVGLDETGELDDVASQLADELDTDEEEMGDIYQSDVARLLMRVGLREALPDIREDAQEAEKQKAVEQASGY